MRTQEPQLEPYVCVIDGDPAVRDSIETLVALLGARVRAYASAKAFWDDPQDDAILCVVCEAELPDESGLTVYERLRQRGVYVPFALLVSRVDAQLYRQANRAGIERVYRKPVVDQALLTFIAGCASSSSSGD
jgi:FixJ family two-component response regulator